MLPRPDEAVAITVLFVLLVESAPSYAQSQARAYADPGTIDGGPVVVVPNRKRPPARPANGNGPVVIPQMIIDRKSVV